MELIHLLLEVSNAPSSWGLTNLSSTETYKNIYHLLELDTKATLDVLRCAFVDEKDSTSASQDLIQKIVDVLALVLKTAKAINIRDIQSAISWPSKDDTDHILDFIAHFVACGKAKVSKELLSQIFEYLTLEPNILPNVERKIENSFQKREKEVLALLEVVPETDVNFRYLLDMCEKAHFYQVLIIFSLSPYLTHTHKIQYVTDNCVYVF